MFKKQQTFRRWAAAFLCAGLLCAVLPATAFAQQGPAAALAQGTVQAGESLEEENTWSIADLRNQFPHGRYWNHADNPGKENNNPMGTSGVPCRDHGDRGYSWDTCNHPTFASGNHFCCWGYAEQLGYLYAGSNPECWPEQTDASALDSLKTGDIIRFVTSNGSEHSVFVTNVSGSSVTFTDCNWGGTCNIRWDITKDKSYFSNLIFIKVCPPIGQIPATGKKPEGTVDQIEGGEGGFTVAGWAFDYDDCAQPLTIRVYLDDQFLFEGTADAYRPDVDSTYGGVGAYHGFSFWVPTDAVGSQKVSVYAVDLGTWENTWLGTSYLTIYAPQPEDNEPPAISELKASDITGRGFTVSCVSTDNVGVDHVTVMVWTTDQADAVTRTADRAGDVYSSYVSIADHGNASGTYYVRMIAYDAKENNHYSEITVEVPGPTSLVTFDANGGSAEFLTKVVESGDVVGTLPEAFLPDYVFEGWYTEPQDGSRVTNQLAVTGDMTLYAHWTPASGVGWQLQNGTLTIDCAGAMPDYAAASDTPWFAVRSQIRRVVVANQTTSIGAYAFYGCDALEEVSLPSTLERIGGLAFGGCTQLTKITLPAGVKTLGEYAFVGDRALRQVVFQGAAPEICTGAFADVPADVYYDTSQPGWTDDVKKDHLGALVWMPASTAELV